ncbi:MAG: hypothetical protein MJZ81_10730 [Bacteroidales bacterium]|nr:hypothetical protein [Bacteroidales bacterium]
MSKTQLKIMLNDSAAIAEIAKDPEVVIKIKKAIVDEVAKRTAKAIEGEIALAVKKEIDSFTHPDTENEVFKSGYGYWSSPVLSDEMRKHVEAIVASKVRNEIDEIVERFDVNAKYAEVFNKRKQEIEEYDFDKAVQKFISKKLAASFKKIME